MRFSFIPRNYQFYDLFEELAKKIVMSGELLADLLDHFENVEMKVTRIKEVEHEADNVTHELYRQMHQTFVTPFDREDIAALADRMDTVVDMLEAAATAIRVYDVEAPTVAARGIADLARLQSIQLDKAIRTLRHHGRLRDILDQCKEINRLENEADSLYLTAMADLFRSEMSSINVIKWKEVYDLLEESTDACEAVAHALEAIVLKHA